MTTSRTAVGHIRSLPRPERPLLLRCLDWLARRDAAYRDAEALKHMPKERLDDMGIPPLEANAGFYTRCSLSRWTPRDPSGW